MNEWSDFLSAVSAGTFSVRFLWNLLLAAAVLFLLWCLILLPRHGHPQWKIFCRYRYAHRGLHHKPYIPENSLAAFRLAAERGYGAELDVHLTRDGRLAVIHDSSLQRTCGVQGNVEDRTAEELSVLRLEGTEESIPFLEDVLPLFQGKTPLIVELKPFRGNWNTLTESAMACLDQFHATYCLESFDPRVLLWLKQHRPEVVRGQLAQNFLRRPAGLPLLQRLMLTNLLYNCRTRPDFIAYRFEDRKCLSLRLCRALYGAQEFSWTIRSKEVMDTAEAGGALVIFEQFDPRGKDK